MRLVTVLFYQVISTNGQLRGFKRLFRKCPGRKLWKIARPHQAKSPTAVAAYLRETEATIFAFEL